MPNQTKRRTAGSVVASVILSLLLLGPLTLTVVLWELRSTVSEAGIRYYLDELDVSRVEISGPGIGKQPLLDYLTDALNESMGREIFTAKKLKKLVNNSGLKSFLSREIGDFAEDFKNGTSTARVTREELRKLIEKNGETIRAFLMTEVDEELTQAVDAAIAGHMDAGFLSGLRDFIRTHTVDGKYSAMLGRIETSGSVQAGDRDLLLDFLQNEYLSTTLLDSMTEGIPEDSLKRLSTAYLREQMGSEASRVMDIAFSLLPFYILLGICAFFILLYFIADRHIPGDAFIGIGALLVTVLGPMAVSGLLYTSGSEAWMALHRGIYLSAYFSGAFSGFNLTANLIGAGVGLGLIALGIILNIATRRRA